LDTTQDAFPFREMARMTGVATNRVIVAVRVRAILSRMAGATTLGALGCGGLSKACHDAYLVLKGTVILVLLMVH